MPLFAGPYDPHNVEENQKIEELKV